MKFKHLTPILTIMAIAFSATSVSSASDGTESSIYCDTNSEIPTTMAKSTEGKDLAIFHWRTEVLPEYLNSQQLCQEVSEKLQIYATKGHQLSSFKTHERGGIPVVCAEETANNCSLVLFTLSADEKVGDSNRILQGILDDSLKGEALVSQERGVQFYGYKVTFWDLIGF